MFGYLVQLGQDGAGSLLVLVFLQAGLQAPVILQRLLPSLHGHVQAGEHAAEPVSTRGTTQGKGHKELGFGLKIPQGLNRDCSKRTRSH